MLTMIVLLVVIALLVIGFWRYGSHVLLWWVWQQYQHVRYRLLPSPHTLRLYDASIVVVPHINLSTVVLLRYITRLPITAVFHGKRPSGLLKHLLNFNKINLISSAQVQQWSGVGILLIAEYDYHAELSHINTALPLFISYICGIDHIQRLNQYEWVPQWLQANFQRFNGDETRLTPALQQLLAHAWIRYIKRLPSLAELWLRHAKIGKNRLAVADSTGVELSHYRLITAVLSMQQKLKPILTWQQRIGICLPPSVAGCSSLLTVLSLGKTVVCLNYTAAVSSLQSAIFEAGIRTIITSRRFMENLEQKGFTVKPAFAGTRIVYLEDIRASMKKPQLLLNLLCAKYLPFFVLKALMIEPVHSKDVAAILFSSGSEGKPKGIELSYENIIGNAKQAASVLEASTADVMMGVLPIFHAFGLTATTLVPLIEGMPVVCHPDPRDAQAIGELVQKYRATILCGTSTFFRLYIRSRHVTPEMFASLRIVVCGAERLAAEVRSQFMEKFGKPILEGYGTTELSPVSAVNRPDVAGRHARQKDGTVGQVIPGCVARVVDPDTLKDMPIGESGLIIIAGVNVMKGYLNNPEKTAESIIEEHGLRWYKTGDKGYLDEKGFLTILDRYSRFAKIGGEMVSLAAVEAQIMSLLPENTDVEVLAVALQDRKKGERIVLLFTGNINEQALRQKVLQSDMSNLAKPDEYIEVEHIPKLGTGKTDFASAKKVAEDGSSKV